MKIFYYHILSNSINFYIYIFKKKKKKKKKKAWKLLVLGNDVLFYLNLFGFG